LVWRESLLSVQEKEGSCCLPGKEGPADVEAIEASQTQHKLGVIYQFIRAMPEVFEPAPAAGG